MVIKCSVKMEDKLTTKQKQKQHYITRKMNRFSCPFYYRQPLGSYTGANLEARPVTQRQGNTWLADAVGKKKR